MLNPRQQSAVQKPVTGPLLIVAGAGSGKTATLTHRLKAFLDAGIPSRHLLAITFTNKAAEEMKTRVASLVGDNACHKNLFIGTFHSFGARLLRETASAVGRRLNFSIFDDGDTKRVIRGLIKNMHIDKKQFGPSVLSHRISVIKNSVLDPDIAFPGSKPLDRLSRDFFYEYEKVLQASNAFDFDDLIEKPVRILKSDSFLLNRYRSLYRYILVDEYQDINPAQYELVRLLVGDSQNLNVVGDDNQAIYGFRGADFTNFLNFEEHFPGAEVVLLEQNYRSTQNIINAASSVISHNKLQKPKTLWTNNEPGDLVKIIEHSDPVSEADYVARAVIKEKHNHPSRSVAVLYRTNAQSRPLEQALIEHGLSYHIFGGLKFYDRKEIKDLTAALRYAFNPSDFISLERLDKNFYKKDYRELKANLPNKAKILSPKELLEYIISATDFYNALARQFPNSAERADNVAELIYFASEFNSLSSFLEKISLFQNGDNSSNSRHTSVSSALPAATLMTIHLSKGLEFDSVIVIGVNEGILPHERSLSTEAEIEEERRLMYVAMTRAKKVLYLNFYGLPSRFLGEIPSDYISFAGGSLSLDDEERYISLDDDW